MPERVEFPQIAIVCNKITSIRQSYPINEMVPKYYHILYETIEHLNEIESDRKNTLYCFLPKNFDFAELDTLETLYNIIKQDSRIGAVYSDIMVGDRVIYYPSVQIECPKEVPFMVKNGHGQLFNPNSKTPFSDMLHAFKNFSVVYHIPEPLFVKKYEPV